MEVRAEHDVVLQKHRPVALLERSVPHLLGPRVIGQPLADDGHVDLADLRQQARQRLASVGAVGGVGDEEGYFVHRSLQYRPSYHVSSMRSQVVIPSQ